LIEDDDFSHEVDQAELSLIEEYVDNALLPEERSAVEAWIDGSPTRSAHAAITAGMRYSATRATKRRSIPVWSWVPIAASVALLIALPYFHHRPSLRLSSLPTQMSPVVPTASIAEDTILLQAMRLRSSGPGDGSPATYLLHANRPTRIQIALPAAAPRTTYSVDISPAIHRERLSPIQQQSLFYLELSVPPGSLAKGKHVAELHSTSGAYRLQFAVDYLP
jgi:hypothetical protein